MTGKAGERYLGKRTVNGDHLAVTGDIPRHGEPRLYVKATASDQIGASCTVEEVTLLRDALNTWLVAVGAEGTTMHDELTISYKGVPDGHTGYGDGGIEALKRYIDGGVERGQAREDYAIVSRTVTRIATPWVEVQA